MGKGKPKKHSQGELANKEKLATQNAGGGAEGKADRTGGKAGHAKYMCYICKQQAPDLKSMGQHFDSKHPKETMDETKFVDTHEVYGGTVQGVAVRGTLKVAKAKKAEKEKERKAAAASSSKSAASDHAPGTTGHVAATTSEPADSDEEGEEAEE